MNQLRIQAADMSSRYGNLREVPYGSAEPARICTDSSDITGLSTNMPPSSRPLGIQHPQRVDLQPQANQVMGNTKDSLPTGLPLGRAQTTPQLLNKSVNISTRRGFEFSLSSQLHDASKSAASFAEREPVDATLYPTRVGIDTKGATRHPLIRSSSIGPLTPPHELESISWLPSTTHGQNQHSNDETTGGSGPSDANTPSSHGVAVGQSGGAVQSVVNAFASQSTSGAPWLFRALRTASKQFPHYVMFFC